MIKRRLQRALAWRMQAIVSRLDSLAERAHTIDRHLDDVDDKLAVLCDAVGRLHESGSAPSELLREAAGTRAVIDERLYPMLRFIVDKETDNRRMLNELRADPTYESAYTDPDPLVSVVIATVGRPEIVSRALPSLLSQSHSNLEILIVGDHAPPELDAAIAELGDPRVRYWNLTQRLVAHPDPWRSWLVGSTMARNEAARHARGQWLLNFDDDDRLRSTSIARMLAVARERRAEVAYGGFEQHEPDGRSASHLAFPPQLGKFAWPAAVVHGGLRFFERELVAADLEIPGDIYMLTRMMRVGVRFAMLDDIVLDYFPSTVWKPRDGSGRPSALASLAQHDWAMADTDRQAR